MSAFGLGSPGWASDAGRAPALDIGREPPPTVVPTEQLIVPSTLLPEAVRVESLGLSIHPPRNAQVVLEPVDSELHLLMLDLASPSRWRIRIQPLASRRSTPAARMIVQDHINRLERLDRPYSILAHEAVRYAGTDGHMLVVEEPGPDGGAMVNGWVVLPRGGLEFTVVTLNTDRASLVAARAILEDSLATLRLGSSDELRTRRADRLDAGTRLIESITPERLRSLVGHDAWHRLYQPATAGSDERELGSVRIQSRAAPRGSIDPGRNPERYSINEREEGLLVTVTARGFLAEDGSQRVDIEHRFWMAWDRRMESWSSRTQTFDRGRTRGSSQTGVREPERPGQPRSTLTVINDSSAETTGSPAMIWTVADASYLCQPEVILLGELLAGIEDVPAEMAYFYFDSRLSRLPQRIDRWTQIDADSAQRTPAPTPSSDTKAVWELITVPALDEPPIRQFHDATGQRLRRIESDGTVVERIDPQALRNLWRRKGLPTS